MNFFKPSIGFVHQIVQASPVFAWEIQARELMEHPKKKAEIDWAKAKKVLGEQIIGRITMVARDVSCTRPESKILFLDSSGKINTELDKSFFAFLQISPKTKTADEIRKGLARDLICWVKNHSQDAKEIGLTLDGKDQLHLLCQRLQPVLDPLPD